MGAERFRPESDPKTELVQQPAERFYWYSQELLTALGQWGQERWPHVLGGRVFRSIEVRFDLDADIEPLTVFSWPQSGELPASDRLTLGGWGP